MAALIAAGLAAVLGGGAAVAQDQCFGRTATVEANAVGVFQGTPGDDVMIGTADAEVFRGYGGKDRICAGAGADTIKAGPGNDRIAPGTGADRINAGSGADRIVFDAATSRGRVKVRAGRGNDRVSFAASPVPVTIEPDGRYGFRAQHGSRTIVVSDVERIDGSNHDDRINALVKRINGGGGADKIWVRKDVSAFGGEGNDHYRLIGAPPFRIEDTSGDADRLTVASSAYPHGIAMDMRRDKVDRISADRQAPGIRAPISGIERVRGTKHGDWLGAGPDVVEMAGRAGEDFFAYRPRSTPLALNGGPGIDTVTAYTKRDVAIDLAAGRAGRLDAAATTLDPVSLEPVVVFRGSPATLTSVENAVGGSGDDILVGTGAPNDLEGRKGADDLFGRGGNDWLRGDAGDDYADGGTGRDNCRAETERNCGEVAELIWRLQPVNPSSVAFDLVTGANGELTSSGSLQYDFDNGSVHYTLNGSFTPPPAVLIPGRMVPLVSSGSAVDLTPGDVDEIRKTAVEARLCHEGPGIGRTDDECSFYGLPGRLFDKQTDSGRVEFTPRNPRSVGSEMTITVRLAFLAQIEYTYVATS